MYKQSDPDDQLSFRAEVQAAIDTMTEEERHSKHMNNVLTGVGISPAAAGVARQGLSPKQGSSPTQ